jgi:hypothetical protein
LSIVVWVDCFVVFIVVFIIVFERAVLPKKRSWHWPDIRVGRKSGASTLRLSLAHGFHWHPLDQIDHVCIAPKMKEENTRVLAQRDPPWDLGWIVDIFG